MAYWHQKITLGDLIDQATRVFRGPGSDSKEALYYQGQRWSFAQLKADVDRCAKGLMGLGVQPGTR